MPVFANRPATCVLNTGEIAALLTEPAQRSRGLSYFLDPGSDTKVLVTYETPRRREMLSWLLVTNGVDIPTEPTVTPIFIYEKSSDSEATPQKLHYLRHAQALDVTYNDTTKEFNVLFYWNLFTPVKQGPPQDYQDHIIETFLTTYKNIPIAWALYLGKYEPHFKQLLVAPPQFPFLVGDPPLDPGGAWPGVYNFLDITKTLLVGGSALHKNFDPFQITDAHQSLPSTPGMVTYDLVQKEGALISLGSIENYLNDHTQHLYHQREIQASRMASRVLMFAKGFLRNLVLQEELPERDDPVTNFQGLTIGASVLTPGVLQEPYVGLDSINITGDVLFPFGVEIPDFAIVTPGDVGHQFKASGGQSPYVWCLRRTQSSADDPARDPTPEPLPTPGSPPPPPPIPYPFDDFGDLVDPEPDFPQTVRGGGMPPGMLLDSTGLFYGTPTDTGVYVFRLHAKDSNGLRGETTIRFEVVDNDFSVPQCSETRGEAPSVYKASVSYIDIMPLLTFDQAETWKGRVGAIGGETQSYIFTLPDKSDPPKQQVPIGDDGPILTLNSVTGELSLDELTEDNFDDYKGVWVFEIRVSENLPSDSTEVETCDSRAAAISIGTTIIGGMDDSLLLTPPGILPEGRYTPKSDLRPYLILGMPKVVLGFSQGKNLYLSGSQPFPLNPQGGFSTGTITSLNPGFANPVQVIGIREDVLSPAHVYYNWLNSNPTTFYRDIYDRFYPPVVVVSPPQPDSPPSPPGSPPPPPPLPLPPPATGAEIDDFIPVGKRIRPLWPV